jgi:hypothetical protein
MAFTLVDSAQDRWRAGAAHDRPARSLASGLTMTSRPASQRSQNISAF